MPNQLFRPPDVEKDRQALAGSGSKKKFWKPKPGDNVIRILPARADAPPQVNYHLMIGKHIMQFGSDWEAFICMKETYGKIDPVCEKRFELLKLAKSTGDDRLKLEANRYRVNRMGLFNILDAADLAAGVQLYECPYIVWSTIVKLVATPKGKFNDVVLKRDDQGVVALDPNGVPFSRQILLYYNPQEQNPGRKYEIYPDELSPIAPSKEKFEEIMGGIINLELQRFYPEISFEEAQIRAFGTAEQRLALRAEWEKKKQQQAASQAEEEEDDEEDAPAATETPSVSDAAPVPSPTPAPAPVPTPVPPPPAQVSQPAVVTPPPAVAAPPSTGDDTLEQVKKRVAALRNKKA